MTREEAISEISKIIFELGFEDTPSTDKRVDALNMAIKALEQEPKTGHWIDDEFGSKCSCCGIHTHLDKFDRPMKFKYCSMCGARMVEPQESEE